MKMNMPSTDKLMNRFFRKVDNVVWDLMTGKLGVNTPDGIASIEGEGDDAQINISFFEEMAMPIPAFARSTPKTDVKVGDLIYTNGETPGWVVSKTDKTFRIMRPTGTIHSWNPPKVAMFGLDSGVMVVNSLTGLLPGGSAGLAGMQSMLLPMMVAGGGEDLEEMLPMMLMMQTMGSASADPANGNNAMMQMMQMQMQMKMMKSMFGDKDIGGRKSGVFRS